MGEGPFGRMSSAQTYDVVVVGAGAAGLWAALACARRGARVLVLEKTKRTGTKILASGGTRCNLTTTLDAAGAGRLFGAKGERFLRPALATLTPGNVVSSFEELGVPCEVAPLEKVFPKSQRAKDVRDALERATRAAGVEFRFEQRVTEVRPVAEGFELCVEGGTPVASPRALLCPGGQSYPGSGTTGDGYAWLEALELGLVAPVPALVPLSSPATWVHELTGLAVQDAEVRLLDADGKMRLRRARPVLFTHRGLSGPGAMDVSGLVARERSDASAAGESPPAFELSIDLAVERERDELRDALIQGASASGTQRVAKALGGLLPRRLVEAACAAAELRPNPPCRELTKAGRHALVEALKGLRVPIDGTLGFDQAEVTRGGLSLREVNPRTMEVNRYPGLYVFGELLDVDGPIGGLNFQAAFATAELAARHATRELIDA